MFEKKIELTFPDGKKQSFNKGTTVIEVLEKIHAKLAKEALAAEFNGKQIDLSHKLEENGTLKALTFDSKEGKEVYWHSSSHLMAQAIMELYPGSQLTIGPAIEEGFYYDIDSTHTFKPEDFEKIEKKMAEISKHDYKVERKEWKMKEAIDFFKKNKQNYKVELIQEFEKKGEKIVSAYSQGPFTDLCEGPHTPSTGRIKNFKILKVSGAYWKGNQENKMLQRIYGISYPKKEMLDEQLLAGEEAEKFDHRKLGKELKIFTVSEDVGQGLPLYLPRGEKLYHTLKEFLRQLEVENGYQYVITPIIADGKLYHASGHLPYYKEGMYAPIMIDDQEYYLRPMNCPHHHQVYKELVRSYRDLPLRLAEPGTLFRYELSGVLTGLIRARGFTQNDAHIYITKDQLQEEVLRVLKLIDFTLTTLGLQYGKARHQYWYRLSLPDFEKNSDKFSKGKKEDWEFATQELRKAMKKHGKEFVEATNEASFYGPKIDIQMRNIHGKEDSVATVQVDIIVPGRMGLTYTDEKDQKQVPVVVHRALIGSYERIIAFLLEAYKGNLPLWLNPLQVKVLPMNDKCNEYAREIHQKLLENGILSELDLKEDSISNKIRNAQLEKASYMLIMGEKELQGKTVSSRARDGKQENNLKFEQFLDKVKKEIASKK